MNGQPRIAIVGAGIGGLTAAIFLRRFGFESTLYEQAPKLERLGAGIQMSPHVTRVFGEIGLFERMARVGIVPRDRYGKNGYTGEITFAVPVDRFGEKYGASPLAMHRGDLQESLLSMVVSESLQLGKRLADISESPSGVCLSFADGSSAEADIVIGADGINSRLREILLGPERPDYSGEVAYRAILPMTLLPGLDTPDITKWWGDDRNILVYFITHARDELYFVTGVPEPDWGSEDFRPRPADMATLRDAFAGFHPDVQRILGATPAATAWPVMEREPQMVWSQGGIVLLGDACHPLRPHMGQGAAMAIEDAVMLARCLAHFEGRDALGSIDLYQTMRRDRAHQVQRAAQNSDDWMRNGLGDKRGDADWLYAYNVLTVPLQGETVLAGSAR